MQKNILWIVVAGALAFLGISHCDSDYDGSGSDSAMTEEANRCAQPLNIGSRGWQTVKGFFFDQKRDECRLVQFSNQDWDKTQNRFPTLSECRKTCRGKVPPYCFKTPPKSPRKKSYPMVTYNASHGACEEISGEKYNPEENIFKRTDDCNSKCRDPELGLCAPTAPVDCGDREGGISYRFNVDKQSCEKAAEGECGPFPSLEECSQRCGRYILKKCNMPALTSRYCDTEEVRYWYNQTSQKCEEITGCADDVTNFKTALDCWETCSSEELSRCLRPPDLGRLGIGAKHYYYNIKNNTCLPTTHIAFWQKTKNKNRFPSLGECERICKPKHQGTVKKL